MSRPPSTTWWLSLADTAAVANWHVNGLSWFQETFCWFCKNVMIQDKIQNQDSR